MAIRPQCSRLIATFLKEAAYGTAVADGSINKLYELLEPSLLEYTQDRIDDAEFIKGHEFPLVTGDDVIIAENVSLPFSAPGSLSIIGLLTAFAFGNVSVAGAGDYTHTIKVVDPCASDQLASTSWVVALVGDTASYWLIKGLIINELRIACQSVGWVEISGTAIGDGTLTAKASHTIPAASAHADFIRGAQADFLTANSGSSPVSKKAKFRGFEFALNNNLDVGDGRSNFADAGAYLKGLRFGNRDITLTVTVEGHRGDEFWTDYKAGTAKDVQLTITKSGTRSLDIRISNCKIVNAVEGFDGIRDTLELTYKLFYTAASSSPVVITVKNADAAYLTT